MAQITNRQILNQRMLGQLKIMTGKAMKFYGYDIDALLAMDDAELGRTMLDYLERYARDERYHDYVETNKT